MLRIKRALISVSDKSGLEDLVKLLKNFQVEIISTGGTAKYISSLGIDVTPIEAVTGFKEILDGRVKTLHPNIHGGLLFLRDKEDHVEQVSSLGIKPIDMVVVNLYPFEKTVARANVTLEEAIENIDIGGPSMVRSAAKNYKSVAVLTDPDQYASVIDELKNNEGSVSEDILAKLAVSVFELTGKYDAAINSYLKTVIKKEAVNPNEISFPDDLNLDFQKAQDLRYGENSHQKGAFYKRPNIKESSISTAKQLHGKELSYNNIMDMDAAYEFVKEFDKPAAAVVKHTNPCGAAVADTLVEAFNNALECDRLSAFGGIISLNRKVDVATAAAIADAGFIECIIAPSYDDEALSKLTVKKNLRILAAGDIKLENTDKSEFYVRNITGGLLVQERDIGFFDSSQLKIVSKKHPTAEEVDSLKFAWKVVKYVKSNAIVLVKGTRTVGIGAGQMSRVDSVFMALKKAGNLAKGAVLASDAFFPKEDAVELAVEEGVTAIIQPGGSKADEHIIALANRKNLSMVFTGIRHFRH
ncbi:MAG: bifunctional phosphoribosylaminoimidazolecarboxamide formyltransferase/IMP cyclohydrolase [Candidatus Omnitrophota bacterium]